MRHPQRLLITFAALITVSSCKSEAPKPPSPKVQAVSTQLAEFTEGVDTVSTLEASNLVELAAQSGGRILELKIRQGDEVAPGQLLVVLDQVEKKAKADNAKANYERFAYLAETGAASQKDLDRYRTQYISAQAELDYSNLTSPSAGTVADVNVKVGDVIQQGQVFTSLVQNNELEARVEVPAVFSTRLALGQPVLLSAPGSDELMATGEVGSIDPRVNKQTQGLLVKAVFANTDGLLKDGQRLRTRVQIKAEKQLAVPFAAVTQTSGQSFVFRVGSFAELKENPGKADLEKLEKGIKAGKLPADAKFALQTPVTVGELENQLYPITKGLDANQMVATTNLLNLKHGMPVLVQPAKAN
ncbi:efflux RND transporter periplasmic adaptor subunit [Synechococcus sp. CC9605]|uniref:efflux RND transporter periplasmic adaptor subunit n=1 Tax=Synechococcus sp. (strain CC9605) TaxID=110662 RepID=UPI00005D5E10|nr:efflux RND transporter periplasmic adaptor subunit [Synechococcus sp. CC9605]ABB36035.1 Secretion protein HlyD [Synechococcus sp. CC9605]